MGSRDEWITNIRQCKFQELKLSFRFLGLFNICVLAQKNLLYILVLESCSLLMLRTWVCCSLLFWGFDKPLLKY